jgi:hypothetical protein|tara:strand:+ start:387 stop:572 length:186 start_codon:yes stop_codon:yes gene_type:complete
MDSRVIDSRVTDQFLHITKWFTTDEIKQLCAMLIAQDLDHDNKMALIKTLMQIEKEVKIND